MVDLPSDSTDGSKRDAASGRGKPIMRRLLRSSKEDSPLVSLDRMLSDTDNIVQ